VNTSQLNCTYWFEGTNYTQQFIVKNETHTSYDGCQAVPTGCCSCQNGGYVDAINIKLLSKYYSEVLNNCSGLPVICPMVMKSPIGCNPTAACIDGVCKIASR